MFFRLILDNAYNLWEGYCVLPQVTLWGRGDIVDHKWVLQVQIIYKFSNERTCTRNKDVQGLSCGFEDVYTISICRNFDYLIYN